MKKSEYEIQADQFMEKTGTTMTADKLGHFPYFDDDKESRDVYQITLSRVISRMDATGNAYCKVSRTEIYSFRFGQSIAHSDGEYLRRLKDDYMRKTHGWMIPKTEKTAHLFPKAPTAYDILACLTKNDPGTFSDFCSDYGYDTDSRKAEEAYFAVREEYSNVMRLFGDVIEDLQEIN